MWRKPRDWNKSIRAAGWRSGTPGRRGGRGGVGGGIRVGLKAGTAACGPEGLLTASETQLGHL